MRAADVSDALGVCENCVQASAEKPKPFRKVDFVMESLPATSRESTVGGELNNLTVEGIVKSVSRVVFQGSSTLILSSILRWP